MTDYALSTNLYTFAQVKAGFFAWPAGTGEAEILAVVQPSDLIVPKFSGQPEYFGSEDYAAEQRRYVEQIGLDYDEVLQEYKDTVRGGDAAVPYLMRVLGQRPTDDGQRPTDERSGQPWAAIEIESIGVPFPLSLQEFLRLRVVPEALAAQFKASVAAGRHLQELPEGAANSIRKTTASADRGVALRSYTVVRATDGVSAQQALARAGRTAVEGDRIFVVDEESLPGVYTVDGDGVLRPDGLTVSQPPTRDLEDLLRRAGGRRQKSDYFFPAPGWRALRKIVALLDSGDSVLVIDNFQIFYDEFFLLSRRVNQAIEIAKRPAPRVTVQDDEPEEEADSERDPQLDELTRLDGLDIEIVRAKLPEGFELPDRVVAEAVTALRAGKHLLLSGPPGTGKSTLAVALCEAVVEDQYRITTATSDWTTFDTIGGYLPQADGRLGFEPGVVLRALQRGSWLVIDEVNRADIDKAFGPLFTLLAGGDRNRPAPDITLPFQRGGSAIRIVWREQRGEAGSDFVLTPGWRLLGTLNVKDKASLFELSFAFLRRFAVIDVPLPPRDAYRSWFISRLDDLEGGVKDEIGDAAMGLAFASRQLGPAILGDIARFLNVALVQTSSGQANYNDPVDAFLVAVRLFAVPQYEGATSTEIKEAEQSIRAVWPEPTAQGWADLRAALDAVALG